MKKIYLDVCVLCRQFDQQNYTRIRLETDALYLILDKVQQGQFEMIVSPVHFKEIDAIRNINEKLELKILLERYGKTKKINLSATRKRAEELFSNDFGVADAAHFAFAEAAADVFITCDDKLLKKCKKADTKIIVNSLLEFCLLEDLK